MTFLTPGLVILIEKYLSQDWADAYKHIHVRPEDIHLQVVEWGGMYFVDRYGAKPIKRPGLIMCLDP